MKSQWDDSELDRRPRPRTDSADDAPPHAGRKGSARVLLAEDDKAMRVALSARLRAEGYDVHAIGDGVSLVSYLDRTLSQDEDLPLPDLIISDIQMPGIDGLEALSWLRQRDWTIPVVLITAFGDSATHEEAMRLGAAAVLDKPFSVDQLRDTIVDLL